ncbi:hypothetical protein GE061_008106, partial [Apolygus lucorum]
LFLVFILPNFEVVGLETSSFASKRQEKSALFLPFVHKILSIVHRSPHNSSTSETNISRILY